MRHAGCMKRNEIDQLLFAQSKGIHSRFGPKLHNASDAEIRGLLKDGQLRRIYGEWFADEFADARTIRALALRTRVGCLSACRAYGLWVPRISAEHVCIGEGDKKPPHEDLVIHRVYRKGRMPFSTVSEAAAEAIKFHDTETGMIVAESALQSGFMTVDEIREIAKSRNKRERAVWRYLDGRSESGSETRVRLFLQRKGVKVRSQVQIPGVGRVDLLVGNSLIIECDSTAHHAAPTALYNDRQRDIAARRLGYKVFRLSYQHIWDTWEQTKIEIDVLIRSRSHRLSPRPVRAPSNWWKRVQRQPGLQPIRV